MPAMRSALLKMGYWRQISHFVGNMRKGPVDSAQTHTRSFDFHTLASHNTPHEIEL